MTTPITFLTKHPAGSIRELWTIAWPMILSSASGCLMLFGDRLVLSFYSQDAFNANIGTMPWYWAILCSFLNIIMITQVFVGQFNGEKDFLRIGPVVWQMIWLSFGLWIFLVPFSIWGTPYLLAKNLEFLGAPYLRIMLLFLPINCAACGALASFFTGRGNTKIVFWITLFANILNILLDIWFVFGGWFIPQLGICGAAWATGLSQVASFLIFFGLFYRKSHHQKYGVFHKKLDLALLKSCLKTGLPNGVGCFLNCIGWAWLSQIVALHVTKGEFTAFGIAQSIYVVCFFLFEGLGSSVGTICSNAIGAKQYWVVNKNLRSAVKLLLSFSLITLYVMVISPSGLIQLFLPSDSSNVVLQFTNPMLLWTWFLFIAEGSWFFLQSMLTAAGDTKFTMLVNTFSYWLVAFLPSYVLLSFNYSGAVILWQTSVCEQIVRVFFMYYRYRKGKWREIRITQPTSL